MQNQIDLSGKSNNLIKEFTVLSEFHLNRDFDSCGNVSNTIRLKLYKNPYQFDNRVTYILIEFYDVCDLKIKSLNSCVNCLIEVIDVHDKQLENIRYHIKDVEEEIFTFYCSNFKLEVTDL